MRKHLRSVVGAVCLSGILTACSAGSSACSGDSNIAVSGDAPNVVILLDKSDSMTDLAADVVSSFNQLLSSLPPRSSVSLYGFGSTDGLEIIIDQVPAEDVQPLSRADYRLGGQTPLYDAIGKTLTRFDSVSGHDKSGNTVLFIISDGAENSSVDFSLDKTRRAIDERSSEGMTIRFIALGEDAADEAARLGIDVANRSAYTPDSDGVKEAFDSIGGSFSQGGASERECSFVP